jgi:hypothetical protein
MPETRLRHAALGLQWLTVPPRIGKLSGKTFLLLIPMTPNDLDATYNNAARQGLSFFVGEAPDSSHFLPCV